MDSFPVSCFPVIGQYFLVSLQSFKILFKNWTFLVLWWAKKKGRKTEGENEQERNEEREGGSKERTEKRKRKWKERVMEKKNKKRKILLLTFLHIDPGHSFSAEPGHLPLCLVIFPVCSESKDQWQLKAYCLLRSSVNMFTDLRIHVTLISPHTQQL